MKQVLAALAVAAMPAQSLAQDAPSAAEAVEGTLLRIYAEGETQARPDRAYVTTGVTTLEPTAAAAMAANARQMEAVIRALRRSGVAERDLQTAGVSLNPQYNYDDGAQTLVGYQAGNSVTGTVREVRRLGPIIDAVSESGANQINSVEFAVADPTEPMDSARREAVTRARQRAELYAGAMGMRIARVISLEEGGAGGPPMPMPLARMAASEAKADTPIAPGELTFTAGVTVTYELR